MTIKQQLDDFKTKNHFATAMRISLYMQSADSFEYGDTHLGQFNINDIPVIYHNKECISFMYNPIHMIAQIVFKP